MIRFSARDLLWLTLVAGLSVALYIERSQAELWRARADYVRRMVRDLGWESDWTGPTAKFDPIKPPPTSKEQPPAPDPQPLVSKDSVTSP